MTAKNIGPVKDFDYVPLKGVSVDGKEILLVKTGKKIFAIGNTCTHMGCKLSSGTISGRIEGETIKCSCHGSVFNVTNGEVVKGPAKKPEPIYTITVENGDLFVTV